MFDALPHQDARPVALLKRAALALFALCAVTALASGYRAWFQVYTLELSAGGSPLRAGSVVRTEVSISGRAPATVRVELVQGSLHETVAVHGIPGSAWAAIDPRRRRAAHEVALTPELLARFSDGPATLRATATGRPQWTGLPPPAVREVAVEIRRE